MFLVYVFGITVTAQVTVDVWAYFCDIYSMPLVCVSIDIWACLSYYSSGLCLEIRYCNASVFSTFCSRLLWLLGSTVLLYDFIVFYYIWKWSSLMRRQSHMVQALLSGVLILWISGFPMCPCWHEDWLGLPYSMVVQDSNISIIGSVQKYITFNDLVTLYQLQCSHSPAQFQWEGPEITPL